VKRYSVLIAVAVFVLSLAGCTTAPSPGSTGKSRPVTNAADVQIIEMISGEKESSYRVEALLPTTDLSSVGQPLADKISQEWDEFDSMTKEQQRTSSKLWGVVDIQTDTWDDCEEAIGFALYNPLETLDWLSKTGYFGMESVDSHAPTAHVQVTANTAQTADRKPGEVSAIAGYKDDDVRITLAATVSSSTESFSTGSVYTGYATYEQNTVTTGSGTTVLIVTVNGTNNIGYYDGDYFDSTAYWVKDNVFYALRVFGNETDKAEIQATLDKLLAEI
jgi:outer membrane lipoprotein SlyB